MEMFHIEASINSPDIRIDGRDGVMEIAGSSTFPQPNAFYKQLARWVNAFSMEKNGIRKVNVRLADLNEDSARWMMFLLKEVERIKNSRGIPLEINWYYSDNNQVIRKRGEQYRKKVNLPFNLIAA